MPPSKLPPDYPDDVKGAMTALKTFPGSRYYDLLAADYPSGTVPDAAKTATSSSHRCKQPAVECAKELDKLLDRSRRVREETFLGKDKSPSKSQATLQTPEGQSTPVTEESSSSNIDDSSSGTGTAHADVSSMTPTLIPPAVSRCGVWDSLGSSHSWRPGSSRLPSRILAETSSTPKQYRVTTVWEQSKVSQDSEGVLAAPLPVSIGSGSQQESSTLFKSTSTTLSCAEPDVDHTLVSTVDESGLCDEFSLPPYPGPGCPEAAVKLFDLALGLDARSAFAVLMASDFISTTAALFHGRSSFYAEKHVGECVSSVPDTLFSYSTPNSLYKPVQSTVLPPKLSGVARDDTGNFGKAVEHVGARGCMTLPTPFSFTIGYDVGMYGRNVGPVWANLDSSFLYDYSVGVQEPAVRDILKWCYPLVCRNFNGGTLLEGCISTVAPIIWANYEALHYKTRIEDSIENISKPCAVVWNDLSALAAYRLVDGGFLHAWFDSDMSAEATAMAGLGIAVHDIFDLGADLSCGEVANVVTSLTGGDLSLPTLAALYTRMGAILRWYGGNAPHDTAAIPILLTFWWQLGNMRHRVVQAVRVTDVSERTRIPPISTIDLRPRFEDFVIANVHDEEVAWQVPGHDVQVPDFTSTVLPATFLDLARDLVIPYASAATSTVPEPPADHVCTSSVMAVLSMGLDDTTRPVLWEWASYLWDSGACWASLLGTLCYRHHGSLNDDRARATHTSEVWGS